MRTRFVITAGIFYAASIAAAGADAQFPWQADAASPQENPAPPAAKFFPINPSAYVRPLTQIPFRMNRAPDALKLQPMAPRAAKPESSMPDEEARKLLSVYPVHN